jgi:aminoglycoside phosphotransferase (APT) family kinase protein
MPKLVETPTDTGLPTLAAVLDPAELARQLSVLLGWDTSQGMRLRVLRWKKANRCTFEIGVRAASAWHELIGKVYAEDRSDVYRAMDEIWHAGFGSEDELAIPRPVAYLTSLRLLLCEKAAGTNARRLIVRSSEADRARAAERCARWLARFQARAPRSGPVFYWNDQLRSLEQSSRRVADLGGPFADKAGRLLDQLDTTARGLGSSEMCAGHGMYTPGQVLLADRRTVTVDWDTCQVADPSHDVARFIVSLKRLGLKDFGSIHALDAAAESFLRTYVATGRPDITARLAFQEAAICLERAGRDLEKQADGWRERVETMLNEGLQVLRA